MLARVLVWRLVAIAGAVLAIACGAWLARGGIGSALRGGVVAQHHGAVVAHRGASGAAAWRRCLRAAVAVARPAAAALALLLAMLAFARLLARRRRRYVRLRVGAFRSDQASETAVVAVYEALHQRLQQRWWRRLFVGQPSLGLEVHVAGGGSAWLGVTCIQGSEHVVAAALRGAWPNLRLLAGGAALGSPPCLLRCKKRAAFIRRVAVAERTLREEPPVERLLTAMAAVPGGAVVQLALTPAPALFERWAAASFRRREAVLARGSARAARAVRSRSELDVSELRSGLAIQHRGLFFADLRVIAGDRRRCEQVAAQLRAAAAENRLVERGTAVRQRLLRCYDRRVARGEGNPLPSFRRGVLASSELAALWQLPSARYQGVSLERLALPIAPAAPAIHRPRGGGGSLRDSLGAVSIHPQLRRQNTAAPGAVEQGKTSFLVATVAEDLARERCAVIVLDPKGDAADAALSAVPEGRAVTLLDFAHPTAGFNPLAVDAPADVIADYVVGALRNLFSDADIRASSDRYLRNAIIAVLAVDRRASLWDVARLLSVGEEGYAYRARIGSRVRGLPEFKEISAFFTAELSAQLADARSMTTSKLDAPVNKLARLLNSASIKRVLLNESLRVDFDALIAGREVLVVKGAMGAMGADNTSVLMQLLVGMLDAALARQQDGTAQDERVAVALKIDEAPLVVNRGFARTLALKRSAGLETVACWQTDAQWTEREVRDQLDALFAHRVYFATASVRDARAASGLLMAEFSDVVRSGDSGLSALARPDVRLHLPRHHAIVSWTTPVGRQPPFIARTLPMRVDRRRIAHHAARQAQRGGRYLEDLRQPHWERAGGASRDGGTAGATPTRAEDASPTRAEDASPTRAEDASPTRGHADPPRVAGDTGLDVIEDARAKGTGGAGLPAPPVPTSFAELAALDGAQRMRVLPAAAVRGRPPAPDTLDLGMLVLIWRLGHVLSSQLHRCFAADRAMTTTQRRCKRLADAGWVSRLQFHRQDGGGVPLCYALTPAGLELLVARERVSAQLAQPDGRPDQSPDARQVHHAVHVAGWLLAAQATLGAGASPRGEREATLTPPRRPTPSGAVAVGPGDLRLPGGRTAHDFVTVEADGTATPLRRFDTVRPDGGIELAAAGGRRAELLVELDDRPPRGRDAAKLRRYDHMLAGWGARTRRYGRELGSLPFVVFVCRDMARARECAACADGVLIACQAYAGEHPWEWRYPGRGRIAFAAERDAHAGDLRAVALPPLPPEVRVAAAGGDPAARACELARCDLALELRRGGMARADS